jgi:multidrug efflux pump subunit AcrA (membrane-fusion protein)
MKKWMALLLTVMLLLTAVCLFLSRTWANAQTPRVKAGYLEEGSVVKQFRLSGTFEAEGGRELIPDAGLHYSVVLEELCVEPGARVKKGDALLVCRPGEDLEAALAAAQRALERARLAMLEESRGDQVLYEAYATWSAAADAALLGGTPQLVEKEQSARRALNALCDTSEARRKLAQLIDRRRQLDACQDEFARLSALTERLGRLTAPEDGCLLAFAGKAGDTAYTDEVLALLAQSDALLATVPVTAEQAAYFLTAESLLSSGVRVGNVLLSVGKPELISRAGRSCLRVPVTSSGAFYGMNCTLELTLASGHGLLLPLTAVESLNERQVSFYIVERREGFWGPEDYTKRVKAEVLDQDYEHVLIPSSSVTWDAPVAVSRTAALTDRGKVLCVSALPE